MSDNEKKIFPEEITRRKVIQTTVIAGAAMSTAGLWAGHKASAAPPGPTVVDPRFSQPVLDPGQIAKFVDPLPVPGSNWPIIDVRSGPTTPISLTQLSVQILPSATGLSTPVWAYRGGVPYTSTYLGPTFLAQSGTPITVTYDYSGIPTTYLLRNGANTGRVGDLHVHGTDNGEPQVRFIAHLHGAVGIAPTSDGYAEAWVTPTGTTGTTPPNTRPPTSGAVQTHSYPNAQQAARSW